MAASCSVAGGVDVCEVDAGGVEASPGGVMSSVATVSFHKWW